MGVDWSVHHCQVFSTSVAKAVASGTVVLLQLASEHVLHTGKSRLFYELQKLQESVEEYGPGMCLSSLQL